jgi:uncharacterized protein
MASGLGLPVLGAGLGVTPRINSLLIKPASALCNLDCAYCFYLDREADPYQDLPKRIMSLETLERLVDGFLFYSYPNSVFAFQGGEPMLTGLRFYQKLIEFEQQYGRDGQNVSNALQTNAVLIDDDWCALFREYNWLVGVSIDGPEEVNDAYRLTRQGQGAWRQVMRGLETLKKNRVEFNVLCVLSQANVERPREIYKFFRGLGIDYIQYIPLAEFDGEGRPLPFTITPEQYGRFLSETFELWWGERRKARIRFFDNLAEALAGQTPGNCTLHQTCDSYAVVEYNGDVYPCDFFVEKDWKLGNIQVDSWAEISRRQRRYAFAANKLLPHPECQACEYFPLCRRGCPKLRHAPRRRFEDLDYFCPAYQMVFAKVLGPLKAEVEKLMARGAAGQAASPH